MKHSLRHYYQVAGRLMRTALSDVQGTPLGQYMSGRPVVLNLLVNDICNSRCRMCNIWQRSRETEMTPDELGEILRDSLFARIRYAGVSGGEPTLRPDLPDIYDSIVDNLPALDGTGIITNAVAPVSVIERVEASAERVLGRGKQFHLMVSMDGVGEVHDAQRGKPGNFDKAVTVVRHFQHHPGMTVNVGCTVTRQNVHGLRQLRAWSAEHGIAVKFRVAEFIDRLYNGEIKGVIRGFDNEQAYDAGLFFHELEHQPDIDEVTRRTYRNVRKMLLDGAPRGIGCLWQTQGITLDSGGRLLYCAPRSPHLGDARTTSARRLFRANLRTRAQILRQHCGTCIHDYPSPLTLRELFTKQFEPRRRRRFALDALLVQESDATSGRASDSTFAILPRDEILITGWYGTETAGDKAILGALATRLRREFPSARLAVTSLYPFVTRRTLAELQLSDTGIVDVYGDDFIAAARRAGLVVVGGGPLMHIEELAVLLAAFRATRENGGRTWILGCGIGPLYRAERYREATRRLLRLADRVELRDADSQRLARVLAGRNDIGVIEDPAVDYVRSWAAANPSTVKFRGYLNCFLREWPSEYAADNGVPYEEQRAALEVQIAALIRALCVRHRLIPRFLPMHHFWIGGDDRAFADRFARAHLADLGVEIEWRALSVGELLAAMREGDLNLCMRYHSVVFAHTLGVSFLALDYTRGGKVSAFARQHDCLDRVVAFDELLERRWRSRIRSASLNCRSDPAYG